jgi:hypothetical protein
VSDNRTAFDYPSNTPVVDPTDGTATNPWQMFFSRVSSIVSVAQQSGPTTARPTSQVWIGRQFYDTTLHKPVYVSAVKPIVWRDAAGTIV